jgi:hypothetical protein
LLRQRAGLAAGNRQPEADERNGNNDRDQYCEG